MKNTYDDKQVEFKIEYLYSYQCPGYQLELERDSVVTFDIFDGIHTSKFEEELYAYHNRENYNKAKKGSIKKLKLIASRNDRQVYILQFEIPENNKGCNVDLTDGAIERYLAGELFNNYNELGLVEKRHALTFIERYCLDYEKLKWLFETGDVTTLYEEPFVLKKN